MACQTRYPSEFKEEAVRLVNSSRRSIADVARSLGVSRRRPGCQLVSLNPNSAHPVQADEMTLNQQIPGSSTDQRT